MSEILWQPAYLKWQKKVFFENKARFTTIQKGRRVGFTRGAAKACIEWICDGNKILWVDTVNSNLQRYYERYFLPELKNFPQDVWQYKSQEKILKIFDGYLDFRSAERPENIEGFGYDIIILNEAGIILKDSYLWNNAISPMMLDNPNSRAFIGGVPKGKNIFYDLARNGMTNKEGWVNYQVTSFDNELLKDYQIKELVDNFGGIDSDVARQEIYGEFLDVSSNNLFGLAQIQRAFDNKITYDENRPCVWGLDVARDGDDESVLCVRDGYCITEFRDFRIRDLSELSHEIYRLYKNAFKKPHTIYIDSVGIGAGVYDILNTTYHLSGVVREAKASYKANQARYKNKRAEMYFNLRDKFNLLSITPNEKLKQQLQSISYIYDSQERYALLPKENIKKEFGFSPDYADALALCFYDESIALPKDMQEYENFNNFAW